jgi:hypothetical protein
VYSILIHTGKGGGGELTRVKITALRKAGRKYQHDRLYLQSINSIKHPYRRHVGFGVFIVIWSMVLTSGSEMSTQASPGRLRVGVAGDLQENRGLNGKAHEKLLHYIAYIIC